MLPVPVLPVPVLPVPVLPVLVLPVPPRVRLVARLRELLAAVRGAVHTHSDDRCVGGAVCVQLGMHSGSSEFRRHRSLPDESVEVRTFYCTVYSRYTREGMSPTWCQVPASMS